MNRLILGFAVGFAAASFLSPVEGTPKAIAKTYESIADSILAAKATEANFIKLVLTHHYHGARGNFEAGKFEQAAADMALFANEGDNAIAGTRKRLVDGGHHHHADGEAKGIYETGFVIVTKAGKAQILAASAALRQAKSADEQKKAFDDFEKIAKSLIDL